jgi:hypothetical protein
MTYIDGLPMPENGKRAIPYDPREPDKYFVCTNNFTGTRDWTKFTGVVEIPDDDYHNFFVGFDTSFGSSGTAWFDNLEIVSPDGRRLSIFGDGTFDQRARMDYDTAAYDEVYARLDGGASLSGAGKPVVRGEAGIDSPGQQVELAELARDTNGVWLHNYVWGQVNPGGLYELYWWTQNIRKNDLYSNFKPFANFMAEVPINDGRHVDAAATVSDPNLRAWGQKTTSSAYLWIQNKNHTWKNVVDGVQVPAVSGTVSISGLTPNKYKVEWWDTYAGTLVASDFVSSQGSVVLALPFPLQSDIAVKIKPASYSVFISPLIK